MLSFDVIVITFYNFQRFSHTTHYVNGLELISRILSKLIQNVPKQQWYPEYKIVKHASWLSYHTGYIKNETSPHHGLIISIAIWYESWFTKKCMVAKFFL